MIPASTLTSPHVHRINVSSGGVPKLPVAEAEVELLGITIDDQRHKRFHGGPTRALCLYSLEIIEHLRAEGHTITPGSTGENITIAGLDWSLLDIGTRLRIGDDVLVEITSHTVPCKQIAASFIDGRFNRISQKHHPGQSRLYARVLHPGRIKVGDAVSIFDEGAPADRA